MRRVVLLKSRLAHRGGLEKYTRRLSEAFLQKGCDVTILTSGPCPPIEGIDVVSLFAGSKFSLQHMRRFDALCLKWLEHNPAEIIFGMERNRRQTHYRAGSGVHATYLRRRALTDSRLKCLSFHLNPLHRYLLKVEKLAFEDPALQSLFTNSRMVKEEILAAYSTPPEKIHVVHNGVEWAEKEAPFQETFSKKREKKTFHFLFVGSGFKRKGLSFLLKGLRKLKEPCTLTVVGKDKNLSRYRKLAEGLKVHFAGEQQDVTPFYQAADALVIPSLYDPFSNVTLEALAMGLFVVSSKYNGGHEILTPKSGIVVNDLSDMHQSLERALEFPKAVERATQIRESVKGLDFSLQLAKIVDLTL